MLNYLPPSGLDWWPGESDTTLHPAMTSWADRKRILTDEELAHVTIIHKLTTPTQTRMVFLNCNGEAQRKRRQPDQSSAYYPSTTSISWC